jgi:8-oxo-dGTP pyrophosphatase MutT (NUDIX family)
MPIKPWKILESAYVRPRFRVDQCELPNGKSLEAVVFEFRSWANVLAVLIKQYRHGVQEVLWEIPGGIVEEAENPAEGVKRELLEETGYMASSIVQVGKFYPNPALQTNTMYCFLALDAEKAGEQHLDDGEQIEVHLVPLDEVVAMAKRGEFFHALQVGVLFHAFTYLGCI